MGVIVSLVVGLFTIIGVPIIIGEHEIKVQDRAKAKAEEYTVEEYIAPGYKDKPEELPNCETIQDDDDRESCEHQKQHDEEEREWEEEDAKEDAEYEREHDEQERKWDEEQAKEDAEDAKADAELWEEYHKEREEWQRTHPQGAYIEKRQNQMSVIEDLQRKYKGMRKYHAILPKPQAPTQIDPKLLPAEDQLPVYHPSLATVFRVQDLTTNHTGYKLVGARKDDTIIFYIIETNKASGAHYFSPSSHPTMDRLSKAHIRSFPSRFRAKENVILDNLATTDLKQLFTTGLAKRSDNEISAKALSSSFDLDGYPIIYPDGSFELFPNGYFDDVFAGFELGPVYDAQGFDLMKFALAPGKGKGIGAVLNKRMFAEKIIQGADACNTVGGVPTLAFMAAVFAFGILVFKRSRRTILSIKGVKAAEEDMEKSPEVMII